jgi:prepilin-type processing-associated H-X9-DG protein
MLACIADARPRHLDGINFVYADGHARWERAITLHVAQDFRGTNRSGYYEHAKLE